MIDFESEAKSITIHLHGPGNMLFHTRKVIEGFGRLVAARVEEETINRCTNSMDSKLVIYETLERLYALKEEKKS